jgi:hypothetical protein
MGELLLTLVAVAEEDPVVQVIKVAEMAEYGRMVFNLFCT